MTKQRASFWIWKTNSTERGMAFVTALSGLSSEAERKLIRGEKLRRIPKLVVEDTTHGKFYDQLGAFNDILFVSPSLRDVLAGAARSNIQFLPTSVRERPELRYFAANLLDVLPAIDLERSKYDLFEGTKAISRIRRLVPRAIPEAAPPIFHASEDPTLRFVSDALVRRIIETTDKPGQFVPAEEYKNEF